MSRRKCLTIGGATGELRDVPSPTQNVFVKGRTLVADYDGITIERGNRHGPRDDIGGGGGIQRRMVVSSVADEDSERPEEIRFKTGKSAREIVMAETFVWSGRARKE